MSGGGSSSKSETRELTVAERQDLYRGALRNMANTLGPQYFTTNRVAYDSKGNPVYTTANGGLDYRGSGGSGDWNSGAGNAGAMGFPKDWSRPGAAVADTLGVGDPNIGLPTGSESAVSLNAPQYQTQKFNAFDYSKIAPYISSAYVKPGTTDWVGYNPTEYTAAPSYINPENLRSLTGGDYNALENSIYGARTAGLDRQRADDLKAQEESLAARGIWSSGLAERDANDLKSKYADTYDKARGEAQQLRYQTQLAEQQALNAQDTTRNQAANSYGLETNKTQNAFNQALNSIMLDKLKAQSADELGKSNAENAFNLSSTDKQLAFAKAQADQLQNMNIFNQNEAARQYESVWKPLMYLQDLWNATKGNVGGSNAFQWQAGGSGGSMGSSGGGEGGGISGGNTNFPFFGG